MSDGGQKRVRVDEERVNAREKERNGSKMGETQAPKEGQGREDKIAVGQNGKLAFLFQRFPHLVCYGYAGGRVLVN